MAIIDSVTIGKGKGSIGNVTLRKGLGGVTIASQKVAKKGTSVGTRAQMVRWVQLSNLVNMYQAFAQVLHPAFEDKPANNSDYNAFVKANLGIVPVYLTRTEAKGNGAVVAPLIMTNGTLQSVEHTMDTPGKVTTDIGLGELAIDGDTSVADFSRAVIANSEGYQMFDQISIYIAFQNVNPDSGIPFVQAKAYEVTLQDIDESQMLSEVVDLNWFANVDGKLANKNVYVGGICYVHSRKTANGTAVSPQRLVVNNPTLPDFQTSSAREKAILSYGGAKADAFLTPNTSDYLAPII